MTHQRTPRATTRRRAATLIASCIITAATFLPVSATPSAPGPALSPNVAREASANSMEHRLQARWAAGCGGQAASRAIGSSTAEEHRLELCAAL
jgi:hypothetical protein